MVTDERHPIKVDKVQGPDAGPSLKLLVQQAA